MALCDTVMFAMNWQPPHEDDVFLVRSRIRIALFLIAEAALGEPSARWSSTPLDRNSQGRLFVGVGVTRQRSFSIDPDGVCVAVRSPVGNGAAPRFSCRLRTTNSHQTDFFFRS